MKTHLAKQLLYYSNLYEHYDIEKQNIERLLQQAYVARYNTPYYCQAYENDIKALEKELEEFPSFEYVKIIYSSLQNECPHEIIDVDKHQCMICHKEIFETMQEHHIDYSRKQKHTSNLTLPYFLQDIIHSCEELDIDLIDIVQKEFYNYKKILLIGGMMQDNPLLFEEDNQEQVYQLLSSLKHIYMDFNHDVNIIGTRKACFYAYPNERLKTYQAYSNYEVEKFLLQLQNESFDYIIDTLEQKDLKNKFPNSIIISYFNEQHISSEKMQQYQIDYAFSTAEYEAHDFKYYMKDGTVKQIAQYEICNMIKALTLKKNR